MKVKVLREKSTEELLLEKEGLVKDLLIARMQHSTEQLEKSHRLGMLRRDIAKIKTLLRESEIRVGLPKGTLERLYSGGAQKVSKKGGAEKGEKKTLLKGTARKGRKERREKKERNSRGDS